MSKTIFNEQFLNGGKKPIVVEKNLDCWVIREEFFNPHFGQPLNRKPRSTKIEILIDFNEYRRSGVVEVNMTYLETTQREKDPFKLMDGYPFNDLASWVNKNGERFDSWKWRVISNGCVRPTDRDMNAGNTTAEMRNKANLAEFSASCKKTSR